MNESLNGGSDHTESPVTDGTAQRRTAMDLMLASAVGPLMKQVFKDKANGMTIQRALRDSHFRNLFLFDLYIRVLGIQNILNQASMDLPPEAPRIVRPL